MVQNSRQLVPSIAYIGMGMTWKQTRGNLLRRLHAVICSHTAGERKPNFAQNRLLHNCTFHRKCLIEAHRANYKTSLLNQTQIPLRYLKRKILYWIKISEQLLYTWIWRTNYHQHECCIFDIRAKHYNRKSSILPVQVPPQEELFGTRWYDSILLCSLRYLFSAFILLTHSCVPTKIATNLTVCLCVLHISPVPFIFLMSHVTIIFSSLHRSTVGHKLFRFFVFIFRTLLGPASEYHAHVGHTKTAI